MSGDVSLYFYNKKAPILWKSGALLISCLKIVIESSLSNLYLNCLFSERLQEWIHETFSGRNLMREDIVVVLPALFLDG